MALIGPGVKDGQGPRIMNLSGKVSRTSWFADELSALNPPRARFAPGSRIRGFR